MTKRKPATNALKGPRKEKEKLANEQTAKAAPPSNTTASPDDDINANSSGPSGVTMSALSPPAATTIPKPKTAPFKQQRIKLKGPAPLQTTTQPAVPRPALKRKADFLTRQPPIKQVVVTCCVCHTRPTFAPVTAQFGACYECRRSVEREMQAMFAVQERRELVVQQAESAEKKNQVIVIDD